MITRREALFGAALGAVAVAALPALSATVTKAEIRGLPREKITLVAPPFVHPHDQIAKGGPK
ncbi:nitrite reductase, copper-containing, partial [Mesorhizobium sp. M2D.F.Ca.ET.145.01.1.1]